MKIYYSQSWEDIEVIIKALQINGSDIVLAITSSGDNIFGILLKEPKIIYAVDKNPCQNALFELKIKSIELLEYEEFLQISGIKVSKNINKIFEKIIPNLSQFTKNLFQKNKRFLRKGFLNIGKFENYILFINKFFLPFFISKGKIGKMFLFKNIKKQREYYYKKWRKDLYPLIFKLFFNEKLLRFLGRDPEYFKYLNKINMAEYYYKKAENLFLKSPVKDNFYLNYILTGKYNFAFPSYYLRENFFKLKTLLNRIKIINSDILSFLKNTENVFTKFYLSDIFEGETLDYFKNTFAEIINKSKKGAKFIYFNHFLDRIPENKKIKIYKNIQLENINRTFFYREIITGEIL